MDYGLPQRVQRPSRAGCLFRKRPECILGLLLPAAFDRQARERFEPVLACRGGIQRFLPGESGAIFVALLLEQPGL